MIFNLKPLSYPLNGLVPYLSETQVDYHYNKHTRTYFDTLNKLIKGTKLDKVDNLEGLVTKRSLIQADTVLFNNAAQAYNHTFYWQCLAPKNDCGKLSPKLNSLIDENFTSVDKFQEKMIDAGTKHFGSGWLFLVQKDKKLQIKTTPNAQTPLTKDNETPLLCIDLWEHSFYLTFPADKQKYLEEIWNIINWEFVNSNFKS